MKTTMTNSPFRSRLWMVAMLAISVFCGACQDDDSSNNEPKIVVETTDDSIPSTDELKVKTNLKTYVYNYEYGKTGGAFIDRINYRATMLDSTVQTIVLHDGNVSALTNDDYKDIVTHIAHGGNIVVFEPTAKGLDSFIRNLKSTGLAMLNDNQLEYTEDGFVACRKIYLLQENDEGLLLPPSMNIEDTNGILCEAYALRGGDTFVVNDLDEENSQKVTVWDEEDTDSSSDDIDNEEDITDEDLVNLPPSDETTEEISESPTDYLYGLHADGLAKWIDTKTDRKALMAKGRMLLSRATAENGYPSLSDLVDAYTKVVQFTAKAGSWKSEVVTVNYMIWSVNNKYGSDFYIINQEVTCNNSQLECGPEGKKQWSKWKVREAFDDTDGNMYGAYWAYFNSVSIEPEFQGGSAVISNVSPQNDMDGKTSYTKSMNWSLTGSFVSPNISSGFTINNTKSYSIPDIKKQYQKKGNNPSWTYTATSHPKAKYKVYWDASSDWEHNQAKEIYRSDITLGHTWIWEVKDASKQYSMKCKVNVGLEGLAVGNKKKERVTINRRKVFRTERIHNITLPQPPRFEQQWTMDMEPDNKEAFDRLKESFPKSWIETFSLYTTSKDDRTCIDAHIQTLIRKLETNKRKVKNARINSDFTLIWKELNGTTDYKSYTYKFEE